MRGRIDQQEIGVLDRVDEIGRRRPLSEARRVGQPPGLGRELDDVFFAFLVYDVVAETAGGDERCVLRDVTRALKEFAGRQVLVEKRSSKDVEVVSAERRPRFE